MNSSTLILEHSDSRCLKLGLMAPELCTGWNILLTSALDKFATRRLGSRAVLTLMLVIAGAGESMRTRSCMSQKKVSPVFLRRNLEMRFKSFSRSFIGLTCTVLLLLAAFGA